MFTILGLEFPLIVLQFLTLKSYLSEEKNTISQDKIETLKENITEINENLVNIKIEKEKWQNELTNLEKLKSLKEVIFDPEYYEEKKEMPIKKLTKDLFKK